MTHGTKKQHFVPQLLLRQFADANGRLFAYDMSKDRSFPTTVIDAGHQNHCLTIPALDGSDGPGTHFESFFQAFEGPAAEAVSNIRAGIDSGILTPISESDRQSLANFIAVQYLRTPAARDQSLQLFELMRTVLAGEIARVQGYDGADPKVAEVIEQFANIPKNKEAELHGEHMLRADHIADLARVFKSHVWLLRQTQRIRRFTWAIILSLFTGMWIDQDVASARAVMRQKQYCPSHPPCSSRSSNGSSSETIHRPLSAGRLTLFRARRGECSISKIAAAFCRASVRLLPR